MTNLPKWLLLFIIATSVVSACGDSKRVEDIAPPVAVTGPALSAAEPDQDIVQGNLDGDAAQPTAAPGAALNLKLSGGLVGFCDELGIDATGAFILQRPCTEPSELNGVLAQADLATLMDWVQNLAGFRLNFEDNPGQSDNMTKEIVFIGQGSTQADEAQQQIIYDWANSLLVRIRPQAVAPPPLPKPAIIGPDGLCSGIERPAVLVIDFERPGGMIMVDPDSQARCTFQVRQPPYGRIAAVAGNIYYAVYEAGTKTVAIWQLSSTGEQTPLPFTTVNMEEFGPFNFTISDDGSKIAWARAEINREADPPLYRNDLWVANIDGSNQITLLDRVEHARSYIQPVRFSPDHNTLYYSIQPEGLGGTLFSFNGRYDSLYSLTTTGGEPRLIYACPEGQSICVGDISPDGSTLAFVQPGQGVVLLSSDGQPITLVTPPATDFVGTPVFGPTGNLAFVSATLDRGDEQALPRPNPGYISVVTPPYTGEVKMLFSDSTVTSTWEWLDENRLLYGAMDEATNIGTAMVDLEGRSINLSPNFALAVLH
jgi:hypothetical protein